MKKSEDKLSWVVKQYEEYKKDTEIQIGDLEDELFAWKSEYKKLKKENKKLNIKVARLEGEIKGLNSVIDKLKEENQTLELWLDNKEKVNKSLRENSLLGQATMEEAYNRITDLEKENKILKEENEKLKYNNKLYKEMIDKIQIAYIKFEEATDEKYKAFRKAYGDLDQVIMNR